MSGVWAPERGLYERDYDDTASGPGFVVNNPATQAALKITQLVPTSASVSTGGAVNVDNSLNTGPAMVLFSSQASPAGRLFVVNASNAGFSQSLVRFQSAGTGATLDVVNSGTGAAVAIAQSNTAPGTASSHGISVNQQATSGGFASAANFVSSNPAASCVQVTGAETGRGSIKIAHLGNTAVASDANAAALSIDLQSSGAAGATAAQGIFIEATTGGTTGNLMDVRNNGNHLFKVRGVGLTRPEIELGNAGVFITMGAGSPEGVIAAPVGSLYLNTTGTSANTTAWVKRTGTGNTGWFAVTA